MASISADTFTVNQSRTANRMTTILYDHSRKYRTRKFYLYDLMHLDGPGHSVAAAKDFGKDAPVYLPQKMAFALWHAHEAWLKTQR